MVETRSSKRKRARSPSEEFPVGESVLPHIWERDPTHHVAKSGMVAVTAAALCLLPIVPWLMQRNGLVKSSDWDGQHGIGFSVENAFVLMEKALGVDEQDSRWAADVTLKVFGSLFLLDISSWFFPSYVCWPASLNTSNFDCYHDMFCEPTRKSSLIRRPGNTYSNFVYFFTGICVFLSVQNERSHNPFYVADAMFGLMLLLLSLFSVLWHGSNSTTIVHYCDLWSMDSCIAFPILRFACLGQAGLINFWAGKQSAENIQTAAQTCGLLYATIIAFNAHHQYHKYLQGFLGGRCPLSARVRLAKTDNMTTAAACLFAGSPFLFLLVPLGVQHLVLDSIGSVVAATACSLSLVVGWSWRMLERFCLDGFHLMNHVHMQQAALVEQERSLPFQSFKHYTQNMMLTVLAALLSPTAALHTFTGLTLLSGYLHIRSLEKDAGLFAQTTI